MLALEDMGGYQAGIATKEKIIDACSRLFYMHGIEGTTYEMISDQTCLNRSLIPYHFKSKYNIASILYEGFLVEFEEWTERTFEGFDPPLAFAASCAIFYRMVFSDPCFMRFYIQIKASDSLRAINIERQTETVRRLAWMVGADLDEEAVKTIACMYNGVEYELILNSSIGFITEGVDEVIEHDLNFVFGMLNIDDSIIRHMVSEALEASSKYSVSFDGILSPSFIYGCGQPVRRRCAAAYIENPVSGSD